MAMTIEFSKDSDRPAYIGLANTLIAPITFLAPLLGGWLADRSGYQAAFLASSIAGVITLLILLLFVKDPRKYSSMQSVQINP
jgi:MFS family permease